MLLSCHLFSSLELVGVGEGDILRSTEAGNEYEPCPQWSLGG